MRGFTLVEVLVCTVIMGLIIGGIYGVLNVGNMTYSADVGQLDLQQNARQAMNWIVRELREASTETIPQFDNTQITFTTPNESGIRYFLDAVNNRIRREFPVGNFMTLANNISNLSFCCWRDSTGDSVLDTCDWNCSTFNLVEIQVVATKTIRQRQASFTLTEKVELRNE